MNTKSDQERLVEVPIKEIISTLVNKQIQVLAEGSELSRHRKAMGELKKERDGIIAEITRRQVKLNHIELPLGLTTDGEGFVIAEDDAEKEEDD